MIKTFATAEISLKILINPNQKLKKSAWLFVQDNNCV